MKLVVEMMKVLFVESRYTRIPPPEDVAVQFVKVHPVRVTGESESDEQ